MPALPRSWASNRPASRFPLKSSCPSPATWFTWAASTSVWVATAGAVGCNLGSLVAYWIGAKGGRPLVERYGKWVLMSHHDLDRMTLLLSEVRLHHRPAGPPAARCPHLYRVPRWHRENAAASLSHLHISVGSWPWCFGLAYAGMKLGEKWHTDPRFEQAFHRFHLAVEIALVAAIVWFVWSHLNRNRQADAELGPQED